MIKVIAVEIRDCSLDEAAAVLERALKRFPGEVTHILPCSTQYRVPAGEGSLRDFPYADTGYLIVGELLPDY